MDENAKLAEWLGWKIIGEFRWLDPDGEEVPFPDLPQFRDSNEHAGELLTKLVNQFGFVLDCERMKWRMDELETLHADPTWYKFRDWREAVADACLKIIEKSSALSATGKL